MQNPNINHIKEDVEVKPSSIAEGSQKKIFLLEYAKKVAQQIEELKNETKLLDQSQSLVHQPKIPIEEVKADEHDILP